MIRQLGKETDRTGVAVTMAEAKFPMPFAQELEFNSPVHGNWNIVHTGMLVPEARQIYVCAGNCMRGVVLTAAEMNASERFSFVIIEEEQLLDGSLEDITIDGVSDVIRKLPSPPRAVLLFTVCLHHFVGCDLERIYLELEEHFPDIFFMRCYMDPIMQKHGLTPDQKLRKAMYDAVEERRPEAKTVTLLGSDFALDASGDIPRLLTEYGYELRELPRCETWEDYQRLGEGSLFISCYPPGRYGAQQQAERLGRPHLYLPACFGYEEIDRHMRELIEALGIPDFSWDRYSLSAEREIRACEEALEQAHQLIGDMPITLDYLFHPRPLGLARLLLSHGFAVKTVYLDAVSAEEKEDFEWLKTNHPKLELTATIRAKMRVLPRGGGKTLLAIGQKAAWFCRTGYFVNVVQGEGLYGYDGIRRLAGLMMEAYRNEKDTEKLVVQKGWGCDCCL